ncbi:thioredoxin family protein [Niabella ginsengisoli]|uniref:Thioredoxin family protein n=1 Tax=Niabella ginsengisoli TaxID=522298 RepID=A0ABS9SF37_9BACT|nr:thioredoxin family protein [Niabella ginsengisoli]MCH5596960.1 thioredoxin family protein [Niabella ginsengisoli]
MKTLTWKEYLNYTHELLTAEPPVPPYDNTDYYHYTKMNETRMKRWLKANPITQETEVVVKSIKQPQHWTVITEPWCGDAAHIVPILYLLSELNDQIKFNLQLRDSDSEIESYLTNGSKSIPILIVRDVNGNDLFHWGPRPKAGQEMYLKLAEQKADFEVIKNAIQTYYNADKSLSTQNEIVELLKQHAI